MMTDQELADLMYRNFCAMWRSVGACASDSSTFAVESRPDMLLIRSRFSSRVPHMVLDPRMEPGHEEDWVRSLLRAWASEPLSLTVQMPPGTQWNNLAASMRQHGFVRGIRPSVAMARQVPPVLEYPWDPAIALATEPEELDEARRLLGNVFGLPSAVFGFYTPPCLIPTYVLREESVMVAAACLAPYAGAAGVYSVGVLPDMRGRGYARRLVLALLRRAAELGLTWSVLSCDRQMAALYRRVGFSTRAELHSYWLEGAWH